MGKTLADLIVIKVSAACLPDFVWFFVPFFLKVGVMGKKASKLALGSVESCVGGGGWSGKGVGGERRRQLNVSAREQKWIGGKRVRECQQAGRAPMLPGQALLPPSPPLPLLFRRTPAKILEDATV